MAKIPWRARRLERRRADEAAARQPSQSAACRTSSWGRSAFDYDLGSKLGQAVDFFGELYGHADAAVARRIARVRAAVERRSIFIEPLHPGHWRIVVFLGAVERAFLE